MLAGGNKSISIDFVWIKLVTSVEDSFAYLETGCLFVGQVAALACSSLAWGLTANKIRLFLVAKAGAPKPQLPSLDAFKDLEPLAEEATLESAGVTSGAWLVAVPTTTTGGGVVGAFSVEKR